MSEDKRKERAERVRKSALLHATYNPSYAFPKDAIEFVADRADLREQTTVYVGRWTTDKKAESDKMPSIGRQTAVTQLLCLREPVNIAMHRAYDADKLQEAFKYRTGYYGDFFRRYGELAPNLAVYCVTPVWPRGKPSGAADHEVSVLNCTGRARPRERRLSLPFTAPCSTVSFCAATTRRKTCWPWRQSARACLQPNTQTIRAPRHSRVCERMGPVVHRGQWQQ